MKAVESRRGERNIPQREGAGFPYRGIPLSMRIIFPSPGPERKGSSTSGKVEFYLYTY